MISSKLIILRSNNRCLSKILPSRRKISSSTHDKKQSNSLPANLEKNQSGDEKNNLSQALLSILKSQSITNEERKVT
jgi:hypothetical protein